MPPPLCFRCAAAHADAVRGLGGAEGRLSLSREFPRGRGTNSLIQSSIKCWKKIVISVGGVLLFLFTSGVIFWVKVFTQLRLGVGFFRSY